MSARRGLLFQNPGNIVALSGIRKKGTKDYDKNYFQF